MPRFRYAAMDSRGAETKGLLEVEDESMALARIEEMQLFPTRIVQERHSEDGALVSKVFRQGGGSGDKGKVGSGGSSRRLGLQLNVAIPGFRNRVSTKALGVFTEELAMLLQAGLPLLRGLQVRREQ